MDRWEYLVCRVQVMVHDDHPGVEEDFLNANGKAGWHLVQVVNASTNSKFALRHYYFERRRES